ncbi:hypothetical protein A2U01_0065627, partial [Trifolium medium]|nr:hypothetical protein [Trifolium medium]
VMWRAAQLNQEAAGHALEDACCAGSGGAARR